MKPKSNLSVAVSLLLGLSVVSCKNGSADADVTLKDHGPAPTILNIDAHTMANDNFRKALWTGEYLQITLMSIPVGGEIGAEIHPDFDQFLRIESGQAEVLMGDTEHSLTFMKAAEKDFAIIIPAGKWHNVINVGTTPLKLYSIYGPVAHPHSTVHKTFEEAEHDH
jgi:mannose-6-phosphate isomerase-like protein (cupin superfamily)